MISKSQQEIESEKDKNEDELFMAELSKIANSIIPMLTTEADFPSKHPELNYKVPILDMAVWWKMSNSLPQGWTMRIPTPTARKEGVFQ